MKNVYSLDKNKNDDNDSSYPYFPFKPIFLIINILISDENEYPNPDLEGKINPHYCVINM